MIKAIAIVGPTASGKTRLSLELSERLGAEIISLDSMQIYKGMNIGTAKATEAERRRIPHHLIDFLSPNESYSTERYRADALKCAREITRRGKVPLFVGGTGLYLDTLLRAPQTKTPESSPEYRDKILAGLKTSEDVHALWEKLLSVDPESAEKIHENNVRRVIRALEIYETTGITKTRLDEESKAKARDIEILVLSLNFNSRDTLYWRIDKRVDEMMEEGLLSEVRLLYEGGFLDGESTASQAIGYKELLPCITENADLNEAVELLKQSTRRYAKRQLTWFRHVDTRPVMMDDENGNLRSFEEILTEALEIINTEIKFNSEDEK